MGNGQAKQLIFPDLWREIPGFDGRYEASAFGEIRSTGKTENWSRWKAYSGKVLKLQKNRNGYMQVSLRSDGKDKSFLVHRLVALAFYGEPLDGMQVCHGNGRRDDNRVENLRWGTAKENQGDRILHGTSCIGSDHPRCNITKADEEAIAMDNGTISSIARKYGVSRDAVRAIKKRAGSYKDSKGRWVCKTVDIS